MFKNEIISHLLIAFGYFLLVSFLRWRLDFDLFWLWFGGLSGTFLLDIDHLFYWFFYHPEKEDSQEAKSLLKQRNFLGMYRLLVSSHATHTRMVFHTALFQIVLLIMAFYILSSGGSIFASGLVMAVNLHLLKDQWQVFLSGDKEYLIDWLFWQIKGIPAKKYLNFYLVGATIIFLVLTRLLV